LTERFEERTQIAVTYSSNAERRLDEEQETHLFRIAQEALTNIARHAEATKATVELDTRGGAVALRIFDNGRGLAQSASKELSLGMVGMRARARRVGGDFKAANRNSGGLEIEVLAPARYREN